MSDERIRFILSFPYEAKIRILEDALRGDDFGIFMGLSRILLDAPISEGGVSTEVIDAIYKKHHKTKQT